MQTVLSSVPKMAGKIFGDQTKLDAGQSPTLARPAAPLSTRVQKLVAIATSPWGVEKLVSDWSSRAMVLPNSENLAKIGPVTLAVIDMTGIV